MRKVVKTREQAIVEAREILTRYATLEEAKSAGAGEEWRIAFTRFMKDGETHA